MSFFKKNKFKILGISLCIILFLGMFSKSLGVEAQDVNFKIGKVNVKCLNVRCGPGVQYNKIAKIYKDDYIEVFVQLGDWYVIKTEDNMIGTVYAKYIDSVTNYEENKEEKNNENNIVEANYNADSKEINTEEELDNNKIEETTSINNELEAEEVIETSGEIKENIILNVSNTEYSNSSELTEEEQEFLNLINANRKNNGLSELKIDSEVQNVARLKAKDLVENNYFSHTSPIYGDMPAMLTDLNVTYKTVGENIAGNNNLVGAVEAWMNSENHKENILSTSYNYTGVAIIESESYGKIFVQVFIGK